MIYIDKKTLVGREASDQLLSNLSKESHNKFRVRCDARVSEKCRFEYEMEYRHYIRYTNNNDGKLLCLQCSRRLKFSGRTNPNCKYVNIDDNFFKTIDSPEKAYLLGWIASDGHISKRGFVISISASDSDCLLLLRNIISKDVPITTRTNINPSGFESVMVDFDINSQEISRDLCKLLNIKPGRKAKTVGFPSLKNDELTRYYIRGYFDGDGSVHTIKKRISPRASFSSQSKKSLDGIIKQTKFKWCRSCKDIVLYNLNAIAFLDYLYKNSEIDNLFLKRKRDKYIYFKNNYVFNGNKPKGSSHWAYGKKFSAEHRDKLSKSRSGVGIKLTRKDVSKIRKLYAEGEVSCSEISKKFGVARGTISQIVRNEIWIDEKYKYNKRKFYLAKKLTLNDVKAIKYSLGAGESAGNLARKFSVSKHTIFAIKHNKIWKKVNI